MLKKRCAFGLIGKMLLTIDWSKLLEMLRNIGVKWRERRLIRNLYMGQRGKLCLNVGNPTVLRLEEESDRDVACHPYYLTYMKII